MRFLVEGNPPRKRKAKKRRTAAQKRATAKMVAANRKRRRTKATARKGRRRVARKVIRRRSVATMARRRRSTKRRAVARRRPVRRRRSAKRRVARRTVTVGGRVYRNPGIVQTLTRGVMDAAVAVAGKTVARFIGSKLPAMVPGVAGQAINSGLAAVAIGLIGSKVGLGGDRTRIAVQGALQAPIEAVLAPVLAKIGLTGYSAPRAIGAYSQPRLMAGYSAAPGGVVRAAGMSGIDDEYDHSQG